MDKRKLFLILLSSILFFMGLGTFLFPYWNGAMVDHSIQQEADRFIEQVIQIKPEDTTTSASASTSKETEPILYSELLAAMKEYNERIYANGQEGLSSKPAYQQPSFILADYGLDSEVFGVLSIPKLELEMPSGRNLPAHE